jgi:hypothetical protein
MSDKTMSMLDDRIAELEDENAALQRENAALRATSRGEEKAKVEKLERENAELLTVLEILARHSCHNRKAERDYNGQVAGTKVTDSGAIAANAMALCRLAEANRFRIVAEYGCMVVGYWPENEPRKEAQP